MIIRLFIMIMIMIPFLCAHAGVVTLQWDADPLWETDGASGVIIYVSPAGAETWSRVARVFYPATTVRLRLPDIEGGYDYKATAYRLTPWTESDFSNTVTGTPDAAKIDRAAVLVVQ